TFEGYGSAQFAFHGVAIRSRASNASAVAAKLPNIPQCQSQKFSRTDARGTISKLIKITGEHLTIGCGSRSRWRLIPNRVIRFDASGIQLRVQFQKLHQIDIGGGEAGEPNRFRQVRWWARWLRR